ncbi:hypothetical protein Tco_0039756 [Tanacetum coccineum]
MIPMLTLMLLWNLCMLRIAIVDALPPISLAEAPLSHNHVKSPQTQDTSTEDDPFYRGSKVSKASLRVTCNDVESASLYYKAEARSTIGDKIGKELLHLAPSPYYMPYPYDEGLSSHSPNMKGEWGEAGSASPPHAMSVCDVSWTLVGIPGLLLRSQLAKVAQPDHQWYQVHHGEHISRSYPFRMEGSGASGGGRTTPKKEARALIHSIRRIDPLVLEAYDVALAREAYDVALARETYDVALTREAYDVTLAREAYDVALARETYDVTLVRETYDVALTREAPIEPINS